MEKRYKSEIMMVLHQEGVNLFQVGAITEEQMREYDRDCLVQDEPPPAPKAVRIKRTAALVD